MKKLLEQKRARYDALVSQIKGLSESDKELTAEEEKTLSEALAEAKTLKGELETLEAQVNDLKSVVSFHEAPRPDLKIFGTPEAAQGSDLETGLKFDGRSGTELVLCNRHTGEKKSIDAEGAGLTEKQLKTIFDPTYKRAFTNVLMRRSMDSADIKVLQEGSDTAGGYLVPADMLAEIIMRRPHPTQILSAVRTLTTSRDRAYVPKHKYSTDDIFSSGLRIQWTGELGTANDDTSLENWGQLEIPVFDGSFEVQISENMLSDATFDVASFVAQEAGEAYDLGIDNVIVNGNGVNKPAGLLLNPGGTDQPPSVNIGNPFTPDNLITLVYGLPPQYQANAKVLMNQVSTFTTVAQLKDTANNYIGGLTQNISGGLATSRQPVMLGKECLFSAFMPVVGSGNRVMVYGDFNLGYAFVNRLGMSVVDVTDRDMAKQHRRSYVFRFRAGGAVWQDRALRVGTQS